MLNIIPITIAIMPEFMYKFISFNDYISLHGQPVIHYAMLQYSNLTNYAQYYTHEKTCALLI